ncbi:MAG: hypothetical protein AAGA89_09020 [Pseudomonadota bacterium]
MNPTEFNSHYSATVMPNQTEAALARNWAILIALILRLRRQISPVVRLGLERRYELLHMLRLAEALARRWLILNARWLDQSKPKHTLIANPTGPTPQTMQHGSVPLLRFLEPDPVLRPGDFTAYPFDALPSARSTLALDKPDIRSTQLITRRAEALFDVMRRPAYHTARMARWLRRAARKIKSAFGRRHPLRVGRPPGGRRQNKHKRSEAQAALWWLDKLARDSLLPGWVP